MIVKIKAFLSGWEIGGKDEYADAYHMYGGSTATHPYILQFFHSKANCRPTYFIKRDSVVNLLGTYCAWGSLHLAGDTKARKIFSLEKYPLTCGEIALPISSTLKSLLPFKRKYPSSMNSNIINVNKLILTNKLIYLIVMVRMGLVPKQNQEEIKS